MNTIETTSQSPELHRLLRETALLDFSDPRLRRLSDERQWRALNAFDRIGAVYRFVRDEMRFGYNRTDAIPASEVLADGYGQCNTKGTLLMALLRLNEIPCRFHGFTIDKNIQKGVISGVWYLLAPRSIIHSWVEVWHDNRWVNLEGFILDDAYLCGVRNRFPDHEGKFRGYAIATDRFENPPIEWTGEDTYIQDKGINRDFGVFETPDQFYAQYGGNLNGIKQWLFSTVVRHQLNRQVQEVRDQSKRP